MRADVFLTPGEMTAADVADRVVVVIDTLRATSTIVQALSAGAKLIYPVSSVEEALRLANSLGREEVLLAGERKCLPIDGFDLGNSPREFTSDRVAGKTIVMSTTNGTGAMALTAGAARVFIGSFLNLGAIVSELGRSGAQPVFLCSGRERHFALEDAVCAGTMVQQLTAGRPQDWALNDGARAAIALAEAFGTDAELFRRTAAGEAIVDAGLGEDLEFCARLDLHDALPVLQDRTITLAEDTDPAAA